MKREAVIVQVKHPLDVVCASREEERFTPRRVISRVHFAFAVLVRYDTSIQLRSFAFDAVLMNR